MNQNELEHLHRVIRSLGPVWQSGFDMSEDTIIAPLANGLTDDDFSCAEHSIGYCLPNEYKEFLRYYGAPFFLGYKLMNIYPRGFSYGGELPPSDDLVAHYGLNIKHGLLIPGEVAFLETDENGIFFYKCRPIGSPNESSCEVYRVFGNDEDREVFAPSILSLFARWVVESE